MKACPHLLHSQYSHLSQCILRDTKSVFVPSMLLLQLSPSIPSAVQQLAGRSLHNPLYIDAAVEGSRGKETIKRVKASEAMLSGKQRDQTPSQLEQFCSVVPCKLRLVVLAACLLHHCSVRFTHLFVCPSVCLSVCLSLSLFACVSVLVFYVYRMISGTMRHPLFPSHAMYLKGLGTSS